MEIIPRKNSGLGKEDIAIVIGVLKKLADRDGKVTPESILAEASTDGSEIHRFFQWDDQIAAVEHRLHQARQLVRSVIFLPVRVDNRPKDQEFFPSPPSLSVPMIDVLPAVRSEQVRELDGAEQRILSAVQIMRKAVSAICEEIDVIDELREIRKALTAMEKKAPWAGKRCSRCSLTGHQPGGEGCIKVSLGCRD